MPNTAPAIKKSSREPLLDIARVVACMVDVMHHAAIVLQWGDVHGAGSSIEWTIRQGVLKFFKYGTGTPIFFALAGFLVMGTLERTAGDRKKIVDSLWRRIRRIIPPYWLAMGLTAGLFLLMEGSGLKFLFAGGDALEFKSPHEITKNQWLGNLALIETWRPIQFGETREIFTRVAWTLCYHEQFIFLALVLAIVTGARWRGWLIGSSISLMAFQAFLYDINGYHRFEGLFVDRWFVFGCGLIAWEIASRKTWDFTKRSLTAVLIAGMCAGMYAEDIEVQIAGATALALAFGSSLVRERVSGESAKKWASLSPWTYPVFLVHLPAETICIRALSELGVVSFWGRTLIVVPLAIACVIVAGVAFGKLVNFLDSVTIEKADLIAAGNWVIVKSGLSPLRIWPEGAVMPLRLTESDELPRQVREGMGGLTPSNPGRRLSDRTPWPNATR